MAPVDAEYGTLFAAQGGLGQGRSDTVALLVRDCDGSAQFLVFSAHGTQLAGERLAAITPEVPLPARRVSAPAVPGSGGTGDMD